MKKTILIGFMIGIMLVGLVSALIIIDPSWPDFNNRIHFTEAHSDTWSGQRINISYGGQVNSIALYWYCYNSQNATSNIEVYDNKKEIGTLIGNQTLVAPCIGTSTWDTSKYRWYYYNFTPFNVTKDKEIYFYFPTLYNESDGIVPYYLSSSFPTSRLGGIQFVSGQTISINSTLTLKVYINVSDIDNDNIPDQDDVCFNETGELDFDGCACSPFWEPVNTTCQPLNEIIQYYVDTNCSGYDFVRPIPPPENITHQDACSYYPNVTIITPINNTIFEVNHVFINVYAGETVEWIKQSLSGGSEITYCNDCSAYAYNQTNLINGLHNITVSAKKYDMGIDTTTHFFEINTCAPELINTSWSNWTNISCLDGDVMNQSRYLTQYDKNYCGEISNTTITEYQAITYCDFCAPNLVNTTWYGWTDITGCLINDSKEQIRNLTTYDDNYCNEVTNTTTYEYQSIFCDYCAPSLTNVTSVWMNSSICYANNTKDQTKTTTQYDQNYCNEITNQSFYEYRHIVCECTFINDSSNLTVDYTGTLSVVFKQGWKIVAGMYYNFDNTPLDLNNIQINTQNATFNKGYILVKGIDSDSINGTKTVYLDNINTNLNWVCIKDVDITDIGLITSNCKGADETHIQCNNITKGGYKCEKIESGTRYRITGLKHSGVIQASAPVYNPPSGGSSSSPSPPPVFEVIDSQCDKNNWTCGEWGECTKGGYQYAECINECGETLNDMQGCIYKEDVKYEEELEEVCTDCYEEIPEETKKSIFTPLTIIGLLSLTVLIILSIAYKHFKKSQSSD